MKQLLGDNRVNRVNISPQELLDSIPQIQERAQTIFKRYEKEGRIIVPRRPIVQVQFNPYLSVKFGRRNFGGNPLAFLQAHSEVYEDMNKTELRKFDPSLYGSLRKAGQFEQAFPTELSIAIQKVLSRPDIYYFLRSLDRRHEKALTDNQVRQILRAYFTYNGNAAEAKRHLPLSYPTILHYWGKSELKKQKGSTVQNRIGRDHECLHIYEVQ